MQKTIIFSDGASKGNPGSGGWGAVVAYEDKVVELGGGESHTTNNRMELVAAISALEYIHSQSVFSALDVYTDSRYVINGITSWIHAWKKRGWKTMQKEDVVNRDLWERLDGVVIHLANEGANISWHYVGGHVGILGNERVDAIASAYAQVQAVDLFSGSRADYPLDITNMSFDESLQKQKKDTKGRSQQKAYSYVSMVDGVVETHATWEACERRVRGVSGARFKKSLDAQDESQIISDWTS